MLEKIRRSCEGRLALLGRWQLMDPAFNPCFQVIYIEAYLGLLLHCVPFVCSLPLIVVWIL